MTDDRKSVPESVSLPPPRRDSDVSVEAAIANRRSRRDFGDRPLDVAELGQLLWAAQGTTDTQNEYRSTPSAGALYPIDLYVIVGNSGVENVDAGVYRYRPTRHELTLLRRGDVRAQLRTATKGQDPVGGAAVDIVVCAADDRTTWKYGDRGSRRYVPMEAGHLGQNIYLQAESLGLSTVSVGAFADEEVREIAGAPPDQRPLYIFPVGSRA